MAIFTGDGSDKTIGGLSDDAQTRSICDGSIVAFSQSLDTVACFTPGTVIATPDGERCVQDLGIGDLVHTRDNGIQHIVWAGQRTLNQADLALLPDLCPVRPVAC